MGVETASSRQLDWEVLATNLRVQEALLGVVELLDPIPLVVFKGPLLTQMIYGDLRKRASGDNDIWIPDPADQRLAVQRLTKAGYRPRPGLDPFLELNRYGQVELFRRDETPVDLHAEPFSARFFEVDDETLHANLCEAALGDGRVRTFNPALAVTHMIAHWVQHHFEARLLPDVLSALSVLHEEQRAQVLTLADKTCTRSALELVELYGGRAPGSLSSFSSRGADIPPRLAGVSDRVRVQFVYKCLRRDEALSSLSRKFLALFLVAPRRLPRGVLGATFLDHDDLVSRYGPGRYEVLLSRHVWRKLTG